MPDLERITQSFVLDFKKPVVNRLKVVNGDTANTFTITLKNGGQAVQLNANLHKVIAVFERADGQVYTQDASTGLTFTTAGVVTIDLRPASFRSGTNTVELQVYKRASTSATEYPLLATTYPQAFTARNETLTGEGENAPSQLPMLEQIIHDAGEAVTNCNNATTAANNAATAANNAATAATAAASSANDAAAAAISATAAALAAAAEANTKAGLANDAAAAATAAKNAADSATAAAESAAADADHAAQQAYTRGAAAGEAASSANTAASAANTAAAAANAAAAAATAAAKKNFYNVKHSTESWIELAGVYQYQSETDDTGDELLAISADSVFASQVVLPNGKIATAYEKYRYNSIIFLESDAVDGAYVTANMNMGTPAGVQLTFTLHNDESPLMLHVASATPNQSDEHKGTLTFASGENDLIYANKDRDMEFVFEAPWEVSSTKIMMRKSMVKLDSNNILQIAFVGHQIEYTSAHGYYYMPVIVSVFFTNGTYYGTTYERKEVA